MKRIDKLLKSKSIAMITCYDATFSRLLERCKCDALLVGDSLGVVIKGEKNTRAVSVEEMVYHTRAARSGTAKLPIISDMPLVSLRSKKAALISAKSLIKAGADMVKIEGENSVLKLIKYLSENGIRVCAHIGYIPQTMNQPLNKIDRQKFLNTAIALQVHGADMIVLSMMGKIADQLITKNLTIPTISFRSSNSCNGQVEIIYDLIGVTSKFFKINKKEQLNQSQSLMSRIVNYVEYVHKIY